MQASISSGYRTDIALHGGWDTHSSALGLQTQKFLNKVDIPPLISPCQQLRAQARLSLEIPTVI
jgi:hypothetical protein